jgi:hypothetical protein
MCNKSSERPGQRKNPPLPKTARMGHPPGIECWHLSAIPPYREFVFIKTNCLTLVSDWVWAKRNNEVVSISLNGRVNFRLTLPKTVTAHSRTD